MGGIEHTVNPPTELKDEFGVEARRVLNTSTSRSRPVYSGRLVPDIEEAQRRASRFFGRAGGC